MAAPDQPDAIPAQPVTPAQPAPRAAFRHARAAVVAQRLGLSDAQKAQLKNMRSQLAAAVQGIRANHALTAEQARAQIAAARKASREPMRAVLTPDQQTRLAQMRSHPRMLRAMTLRRMRMAAVARRLDLTADQRTQIRDIRRQTLTAVKGIRDDAKLTPEQRKAKVREIVQNSRGQIRGVLSPDQQQRLQRMRRRLLARLGPLA